MASGMSWPPCWTRAATRAMATERQPLRIGTDPPAYSSITTGSKPLILPTDDTEREKKLKAEEAKRSPRKSPAKAAATNENQIDITLDDLLQVKTNFDEKNRGMLWKIANPGKRLPKNF